MSNKTKTNNITTKRFVIRKSLIGTNTVITFTTKKGKQVTYDHDEVYNRNKERFESMNCFKKYKSYTNTNNIPTFCRQLVLTSTTERWLVYSKCVQHKWRVSHGALRPTTNTNSIRTLQDNIYEYKNKSYERIIRLRRNYYGQYFTRKI